MIVRKDEVIELFELKKSGGKGWYEAQAPCPYCGKRKHMGVIFNKISSFKCQRCHETGTLYKLLSKVGRLDLHEKNKRIDIRKPLSLIRQRDKAKEIDYSLPPFPKPHSFRRIFKDEYLESRGFKKEWFKEYEVGIAPRHPRLKHDYIVIILKRDEESIGWIARSRKSKEKISILNKKKAQNGQRKYLRYMNSTTDFAKYLLGEEELNCTKEVLLVEGMTDKFNVDNLLELDKGNTIKCLASFNNDISKEQIEILKDKGVERVIVFYDPDTIKINKKSASRLTPFFETKVATLPDGVDPGDATEEELLKAYEEAKDVVEYFHTKIQKRELL